MKISNVFIVGLLTIAVTIWAAFFQNKTADLRYSFSGSIPINEHDTIAQQLQIKNSGDKSAERIIIEFTGDIERYTVEKNTESDEVIEHRKNNGLQLEYPLLPPEADISIVVFSLNKSLTTVHISHNDGVAKAAFDTTEDLVSTIIIIFYLFLMLILLYWVMKEVITDRIYWDSLYDSNAKKILMRKKPFIIKEKAWNNVRGIALSHIETNIYRSIMRSSYEYDMKYISEIFSDSEWQLMNISNEEGKKLTNVAISVLDEAFCKITRKTCNFTDFEKLFTQEKPEKITVVDWNELQNNALSTLRKTLSGSTSLFCNYKLSDFEVYKYLESDLKFLDQVKATEFKENIKIDFISNLKIVINKTPHYNIEKLINILEFPQPVFFSSEEWNDIKSYTASVYWNQTSKQFYSFFTNKEGCEKELKKIVPASLNSPEYNNFIVSVKKMYKTLALESLCENRYFIEKIFDFDEACLEDYDKIKNIANAVITTQFVLQSLQTEVICETTPEHVQDELFEIISTYVITKKSLDALKIENEIEKKDTQELKEKILAQLKFINEILTDPRVVDNIEEYEDLFSKGNYENLKRIGKLLRDNL